MSMWYRWWKAIEATASGAVTTLGALLAVAGLVLLVIGKLSESSWLTAMGWVALVWLPVTIARMIIFYRRGLSKIGSNSPHRDW